MTASGKSSRKSTLAVRDLTRTKWQHLPLDGLLCSRRGLRPRLQPFRTRPVTRLSAIRQALSTDCVRKSSRTASLQLEPSQACILRRRGGSVTTNFEPRRTRATTMNSSIGGPGGGPDRTLLSARLGTLASRLSTAAPPAAANPPSTLPPALIAL